MKKAILTSLMLVMVFAPGIIRAEPAQQQSIDKLMALSGLNKQAAEIPGVMRDGVEQASQDNSSVNDAKVELLKAIESAFQPSEILGVIATEIKNALSEDEVKKLLVWYESDLGRKITKAEEEASTPAAYQAMTRDSKTVLADLVRVKYAKKMDRLMNVTDMLMEAQDNAAAAMFTAISLAMKPNQPVDMKAFRAQMLSQQENTRPKAEQSAILSLVFTYKAIDTADLDRYILFLEKPESKKLIGSTNKGIIHAFGQATDKMAKLLVAALKKTKK